MGDTALPVAEERLFDRIEAVPDDPPAGDYVVVDVLYFSTTVVELLAGGAKRVHVPASVETHRSYCRRNPEALIGGEPGAVDAEDFTNSPSEAAALDVEGRTASLRSANGARAVTTLRDRLGSDDMVYVGSTTNAAALGWHLQGSEEPTYYVCAGSRGERAVEDMVGALLVGHYRNGDLPTPAERDGYRALVEVAKGPEELLSARRRRDVREYALDIASRAIVPELHGDELVDVSTSQADRTRALQSMP
jgi:2-phosphosulfolactate phosphatase